MKLVRVDKNRQVEVPETWIEGERMLTHALNAYHDRRGGKPAHKQVATRWMARWPTARTCEEEVVALADNRTGRRDVLPRLQAGGAEGRVIFEITSRTSACS
jgi:hypothetical protein